MPQFSEHIAQANHNLNVLKAINNSIEDSWDWQVTVAYYAAVHIINAHISKIANLHYRTHKDVENAISPFNQISPASIDQDTFLAFQKLNGLSRRSRYLIHDDSNNKEAIRHFTYDKHFAKAMKKLDIIIDYFSAKYPIKLNQISISCIELKAGSLNNFLVN